MYASRVVVNLGEQILADNNNYNIYRKSIVHGLCSTTRVMQCVYMLLRFS